MQEGDVDAGKTAGEFLAYGVLQGIDLTVERLNLPPGLIGLLLGLPQRIVIALCRLSQVSKLRGQEKTT